jgi:hypothetical protein
MLYESNPYAALWNKYRPVILKLMMDAGKDPQHYKLYAHEFKAVGMNEKAGYSFVVEIFQNKAISNIKASAVARDLVGVLQQSQKATQLLQEAVYEFKMDKQYVFHVTRKVEAQKEVVVG